jgi:3-oxoacyl-[acyl-carrier-protein] synthase III
MSFISVDNVCLSGVVSVVPEKIESNRNSDIFDTDADSRKFIKMTGIEEKRIVDKDVCVSDLCFKASEILLDKLQWDKSEIDVLIMVTQSPDYKMPSTSIILQDRLGLPKSCICFDVPLGCSGYVYGLSIISQFLQSGNLKKGLLLVGDALSKNRSLKDKTTAPLFGDAGTASAIEYNPDFKMKFNLWSDGSGHKAIYVPDGGARNPLTAESLEYKEFENGSSRKGIHIFLNGTEVFTFGINVVPKEFEKFLEHFAVNIEDIDHVFFHQANKLMNEMIRKKVGFKKDQVNYSLTKYGNTNSASIPLTLNVLEANKTGKHVAMCGFGIGLSIGIVTTKLPDTFISHYENLLIFSAF